MVNLLDVASCAVFQGYAVLWKIYKQKTQNSLELLNNRFMFAGKGLF